VALPFCGTCQGGFSFKPLGAVLLVQLSWVKAGHGESGAGFTMLGAEQGSSAMASYSAPSMLADLGTEKSTIGCLLQASAMAGVTSISLDT
jgi:hypothetical protein